MRNYSFDVLKLFLSLLVVFIHIHVPWRDFILPFTRCAVPCFFMISGFFLYNMDKDKMRQRVGQGIRRMFNITFFATLLYMIPWILHHMQSPDMYQIDFIDLVNFVFWGIPLFLPEGIHLWYLQAYLYVLIAVYVLLRKSYFNRVLIIAVPLLFTLHILWKHIVPMFVTGDTLTFALLGYFPAYLSIAFPAVGLGMLVRKYQTKINCFFDNKSSWALLFASVIMCYLEVFLLKRSGITNTGDILVFTPFVAFELMMITQFTPMRKPNIMSEWGEKYSLYVYICHPFIGFVIGLIREDMPSLMGSVYHWFSPMIIFFISIIISMIILSIQNYLNTRKVL